MFIDGVAILTPTIAACVPISIENDAIAYDAGNDRFKVDIEAMTLAVLDMNLTQVLDAALSHANPVISRLTDGSAFIDPRDVSDRAARLLGVVYGSLDKLQQRATSKDLFVQLRHNAAEIDPRDIRALTSSDIIKAYGSQTQALLQRATTYDLLIQLRHAGAEIDPRAIRALTNSDVVTVEQATAASLKATVTQDAKDRTVTDVSYVGTLKQISNTFAAAGNYTVWDPAADKKVRVKLISLELSADVDLGFRFGAEGTIYYLRTTKGVIVTNFIGANVEGAVDDNFILNASAACVVKGYVIGEEV